MQVLIENQQQMNREIMLVMMVIMGWLYDI